MISAETLNQEGKNGLPGYLGIQLTSIGNLEARTEFVVQKHHMAPNGFLHAGSVVSLADSACGYGCLANLPDGATSFTTIELKSNYLGTTRDGTVDCVATAVHIGRTTQVWDAVVTHRESGKKIALFRCSQMMLYPT